jgi:hypothetical protein
MMHPSNYDSDLRRKLAGKYALAPSGCQHACVTLTPLQCRGALVTMIVSPVGGHGPRARVPGRGRPRHWCGCSCTWPAAGQPPDSHDGCPAKAKPNLASSCHSAAAASGPAGQLESRAGLRRLRLRSEPKPGAAAERAEAPAGSPRPPSEPTPAESPPPSASEP